MADLKVNKEQWEALSTQDQEKISTTLRKAGTLKEKDRIVGDAAVARSDTQPQPQGFFDNLNPVKKICELACDAAAATGAAACAGLSGPAVAVCLVAVEVARQECRSHC